MNGLFSMQGRLNRQKYFFMTLVITIIAYALSFVIGFLAGFAGMSPDSAGFLGFIVGIGAVVIQAFLVVRRCHDLGRAGTHYWFMYIPLYNIYFGLVLLFVKGETGPNQYGEDPAAA